MLTEGYWTVKSDTKYCEFVGSSDIIKWWRYDREFIAGVIILSLKSNTYLCQ